MATYPTTGRLASVNPNELIDAAWHDALRDRSVPYYADAATLRGDQVSYVAVVVLPGAGTVWATRAGSTWKAATFVSIATTVTDDFGTAGVTAASLGLTSIDQLVINASWDAAGANVQIGSARVVGGAGQVRLFETDPLAGVANHFSLKWATKGISVTLGCVARGTV